MSSTALPFTVSKKSNWDISKFVKVPIELVMCDYLQANSRLLLIMLINQVGFKPVSIGVIDRCLGMHRSTRIRCLTELKELGFIGGTDSHIILNDPVLILKALRKERLKVQCEVEDLLHVSTGTAQQELTVGDIKDKEVHDYLQEAADAWNRYRPKDYRKIRRMSMPLLKALDTHIRELGVKPHQYEEFFSILKSGIEKSDFWAKTNSSKTLQSIIGIGSPTDKKRLNVYSLFNDGVEAPSKPIEEEERIDTIVFPMEYRAVIDEYESAQMNYSNAYFARDVTQDVCDYVIRTEQALRDIGLDPAMFRYKYGIKDWPTDTPEPKDTRVTNWVYEGEYSHAY